MEEQSRNFPFVFICVHPLLSVPGTSEWRRNAETIQNRLLMNASKISFRHR